MMIQTLTLSTTARRSLTRLLCALAALLLCVQLADAQQPRSQPPGRGGASSGPLEVDITQGTLKPIPIAVAEFVGDDPRLAVEVSNVVSADLERSGLFAPIDRASFLQRVTDINVAPRFNDWRVLNVQALVVGKTSRAEDGRLAVEFRAWDVFSGRELVAKRFVVLADEWRRLGHRVADQVYERLAGEKGYFDTQVVFIDETGPKDRRNKRLALMDQDGANVRLLSQGKELVLTPRFSPSRQQVAYMQYTGDQPRVFLLNLDTGQRDRGE